MSYPLQRKRNGFTLVELLVVVGIIGVLVSILLPSLGRAREAANRIVCAINLRQIATAAIMYANENQGNLPRTYWKPGAGLLNSTQGGRDNSPTDNPFSIANPEGPVGAANVGASVYLLLREGKVVPDTFRCPSNTIAEALDPSTIQQYSNFPSPMRKYNSYSFIALFPNNQAMNAGWNCQKIANLTPEHPIASDINPGKGGKNFSDGQIQDVTSVRYDDGPKEMIRANSNNHKNLGQQVAFADGHVEWWSNPFCGPTTVGRRWRDNIFANTKNVDPETGLGGTVHTQPMGQADVVLHPGDGAN